VKGDANGGGGNALDTSGDSAVSSASFKSSNNDVFGSENNKENIRITNKKTSMKPPAKKPSSRQPTSSGSAPVLATANRGSQNSLNNAGTSKATPKKSDL